MPDRGIPHEAPRSLARRLLWFVALWLGGVGSLGLIAFGLRLWLAPTRGG
jgi:hypothetical protein